MSIWAYEDVSRQPQFIWTKEACRFCQQLMTCIYSTAEDASQVWLKGTFKKSVFVCSVCGWWKADGFKERIDIKHRTEVLEWFGAAASLRELDLTDVSTPITEVRSYLAAKYASRFDLHPRIFEETVASVFRDHGFVATVTAYSGDGGIDTILERGTERIGVQVKRYKNSIGVEQIRSLAGALVLKGMTQGMFVTTSTFQSGAASTADDYVPRGYRIELLDAERFYDALKIAQRKMYESLDEFPVHNCLGRLRQLDKVYAEDAKASRGIF